MKKDIPIYNIVLKDGNQGVGMISLVDDPAIGVDWIKLSKQEVSMTFKANKDKQLLYGPFLIPNMLIYRYDDKMGEYYIRFSKEEIAKIADRFNEDLNNKNINFMHTDQKVEAFVASNWMIEGEQDKSHNLGFDLPEGTWFGGVKVKDEKFWIDKVKSDEVKGFSVEILADLELSLKNKEQVMEKEIKLASAKLKDGSLIYFDGATIAVSTAVFSDDTMTTPSLDGDYELEDGTMLSVAAGVVVEINAPEGPAAPVVPVQQSSDLAVPAEVVPNTSTPLTAEEVSAMIDARFSDLMDEISQMKTLIGEGQVEMSKYKKDIEEKFSSTPAAKSINKPEAKMDVTFSKDEARIREFARIR